MKTELQIAAEKLIREIFGVKPGETVTITTDGEDEAEAMEGIITLIKNGLDD